jgi:hypothetical protein
MKKPRKTAKTPIVDDPAGCSEAASKLRCRRTLERYAFMRPPHPSTKYDGVPVNRLSPDQIEQLAADTAAYENFWGV